MVIPEYRVPSTPRANRGVERTLWLDDSAGVEGRPHPDERKVAVATGTGNRSTVTAKPDPLESRGSQQYFRELWDASTFALTIQLVLAVFYILSSRNSDFRLPLGAVLGQLGIGLIVLLLPDLLSYRSRLAADRSSSSGVALRTALTLSILVGVGFLISQLEWLRFPSQFPRVILASCGLLVASTHVFVHARHPGRLRSVAVALLGVGFGIYVSLAFWGTGYHSPFFTERILSGIAHIDTLFHSSVGNLFQTYFFPTIGLDGVLLLKYHTGSHFVLGSLAGLGQIPVVDFYNVSYPIVFIPLFFKALLLSGLDLARSRSYSWSSLWSASVLVVVFTSLPWPWSMHPFVSESTLIALTAGLFLLSTTVQHARDMWFYPTAFGLALFSVFSKISVGVPVFVCLAYLFFRCREYRTTRKSLQFVAYVGTAGVLTWLFVYPAQVPADGEGRSILDVVDNVFKLVPPVAVLYLSWLIATALVVGRSRSRPRAEPSASPKSSLRTWWEVLSVLGLSTLAFAIYVWRNPSDSLYFLITYFFLSMPALLVLVQHLSKRARVQKGFLVALSVLAPLCLLSRADALTGYHKANRFRSELAERQKDPRSEARIQLLEALKKLDKLSKSRKRSSAVFVPRTNTPYWELLNRSPSFQFLVQATSGIAMIGGQLDRLFIDEKYPYPYYDLFQYRRDDYVETVEEASAEASRRGYEDLIIVDYREGGITVSRQKLPAASFGRPAASPNPES